MDIQPDILIGIVVAVAVAVRTIAGSATASTNDVFGII